MSLFDLSFVVDALSNAVADFSRPTKAGYDNDGRALPKTWSVVGNAIKISFQPVEDTHERDPEGFGTRSLWTVWAPIEMRNEDRVTVEGVVYGVEKVEPWASAGNYWKATVRQPDESEI